ncbi:MAG TPA: dihydrodipicolinate synthase family protein [Firmicutes bacterium]|uniref:Dihydrodipicolinate synthase family protein n=1 Tax=Capillibacterium thermochitinicola TaxID=2699427 RepID=A0A8J6I1G0_9FIRM|nr:dihydrodipicolinate synthase family protein [Capillibacterium thermochitinicola]MBA2133990.1 dihydrodipicolinate synthase family protein [Capillibacterium thermochitinicola]HHW13298.1 dihydrodipicolinate synthase family protein [Bacillota bacterium]
MTIREQLSGVFTPMVTPFKNDEILYDGIVENVKKMNRTGLRGYFVLGTNGEFRSLSVEERLKVLKTVVDNAAPDKIVMAGTSAESTKETIDITKEAAKIGAKSVSLLMPHFFRKHLDDDAYTDYIIKVADASPVPVLLYNNPSVAADVLISPEVIRRVAEHPNVVGMKDSSRGNYQKYLEAAEGKDFYLLAGSAGFFLDLLKAGGVGGVLSLANVFPDACAKLYEAYKAGNMEEAEQLNAKLVELNKKVSGFGGVAAVKSAMNLAGYTGGDPRHPLRPLTAEQKADLEANIKALGFI